MVELKEGDNCWRISKVERLGFILSGQDYFRAFRQALIEAEHCVYILAWDLNEKVEMIRSEDVDDGYPEKIGDFIFAILEEKPDLEVYILLWDYSMIYAAEREWLPFTQWRNRENSRLHIELDDSINMGASHHQKVVVVDERLVFSGGFDLSAWRWDTAEHRAKDTRRKNPKGDLYQPYHDIQTVMTGPVVADFCDLCAMRWERATGEALPRLEEVSGESIWPKHIDVDVENERLGLALTFSRFKEYEPSFHIEKLHLDVIGKAERTIYIENQYLSSHTIVEALAKRLKESDGPEVVIVLTRDTEGWMEEGTMGVLRDRLLEILSEADSHDRFKAYFPFSQDEEGAESQVYVHAKLLIADGGTVLSGSANLSNRSMKVDSEVNFLLMGESASESVELLLKRLLAMHHGKSIEDVGTAIEEEGSLVQAIERLRQKKGNRLDPLDVGSNSAIQRKLADSQLLDPNEPISPAYWMREALRKQKKFPKISLSLILKIALVLAVCLGSAYLLKEAWGGVIDKESVVNFFEGFEDSPYAYPMVFGVFFVSGLIAIPINLLLVAGTIVIGPLATFICGLLGALGSAVATFWIGSVVGKPIIEKFAGKRFQSLSEKIGSRGVFSVALIRVVPIAPFVVINLVAGFSKLRFPTFIGGSLIGMAPGMLGVVLVTYQIESAIADPSAKTWIGAIAVIVLCVGAVIFLRKKFKN